MSVKLKIKILVSTSSGLISIPLISASPLANDFAFAWSSLNLILLFSSAYKAPAAMIPACLMPPPNCFRKRLASIIKSLLPTKAEPTGAPSPFEKQTLIESK